MKKCLLYCVFLLLCVAPAAVAEEAFAIDAIRVYDKMARPYGQGYSPVIEGNTAHIVLPLLSDAWRDDIEAELILLYPDESPVKYSNTLIRTVKRGEYSFSGEKVGAYLVHFKLALYPSRQNGEYPLNIALRWGDGKSQVFPVTLRVEDGYQATNPPDVAIAAFDAPEALFAGGDGILRLNIENRSRTREAKNIYLTISDASGDILPKESDTIAVGNLAAGESEHIAIPVRAIADAAIEPHAVAFSLSFDYDGGKTAGMTEKRTVDIHQEARLNHTEAQLPVRVTQGDNIAFNLTLMNMGKGALYNALLTFDVPHMAAGGSVLAGNIAPGASASANANLRVDGGFTGEVNGTLTLTWEDGYGNAYEKILPLSTTVMEKTALPAASNPQTGLHADSREKFALREIAAWCAAGIFLALFLSKTFLANRKIRKLEESKL